MADTQTDNDCVSKKPWSEVLSRSLKVFAFNAAGEGGKSIGRILFYVILGLIAVMISTYVIDSFTGWFSSWFDVWPFNRAAEPVATGKETGWFSGWNASDEPEQLAPAAADDETKWYCRWNPIC